MPTRHAKHQQWTPQRLKAWARDLGPHVHGSLGTAGRFGRLIGHYHTGWPAPFCPLPLHRVQRWRYRFCLRRRWAIQRKTQQPAILALDLRNPVLVEVRPEQDEPPEQVENRLFRLSHRWECGGRFPDLAIPARLMEPGTALRVLSAASALLPSHESSLRNRLGCAGGYRARSPAAGSQGPVRTG